MRSEPGRVIRRTVAGGRTFPASRSSCSCVGAGRPPVGGAGAATAPLPGLCASASGEVVASAAAPAAALFRKPRRPTALFADFAIVSPCWVRFPTSDFALCRSGFCPARGHQTLFGQLLSHAIDDFADVLDEVLTEDSCEVGRNGCSLLLDDQGAAGAEPTVEPAELKQYVRPGLANPGIAFADKVVGCKQSDRVCAFRRTRCE